MFKTIVFGSQNRTEFYRLMLENQPGYSFQGYYNPEEPGNTDHSDELLLAYDLCSRAEIFIVDASARKISFSLLENLIRLGKHLLFDGFSLQDPNEIKKLKSLSHEGGNTVHIANVLRNKPLFTTAFQYMRNPRFVKIEKHCPVPFPGEFSDWLFNNLAEELDIVFRIFNSPIRSITARPMFLFGDNPDLLNIQIEFDNDSICHISAGRAIETGLHKFRIFQKDKLFQLDFAENQLIEYRPQNESAQLSMLNDEHLENNNAFSEIWLPIMPFDPWQMDLRNFMENIEKNLSPLTGLDHLEQIAEAHNAVMDRVHRKYMSV